MNKFTHQIDYTLTNLFYRMSFLVLKVQKIRYQFAGTIFMKKILMMSTNEIQEQKKKLELKEEIVCYGELHADVFTRDKLLLPNVNV